MMHRLSSKHAVAIKSQWRPIRPVFAPHTLAGKGTQHALAGCARRDTRRHAAEDAVASESEASPTAVDRVRLILQNGAQDKDELEFAVDELEAELKALRENSAATVAEAALLQANVLNSKDQLLRLTADFDNFRRRTAQQTAQTADAARGEVMKQLLPIIDGFEQARTQVKAETEGELKINNSYQGLYKQMVELLRNLGVEPVATVGSPFDPEIHEAIMREASSEHPDGTVLVEFRKGFRLGDKLLRPAMVQVSFRDDDSGSSSNSSDAEATSGSD